MYGYVYIHAYISLKNTNKKILVFGSLKTNMYLKKYLPSPACLLIFLLAVMK